MFVQSTPPGGVANGRPDALSKHPAGAGPNVSVTRSAQSYTVVVIRPAGSVLVTGRSLLAASHVDDATGFAAVLVVSVRPVASYVTVDAVVATPFTLTLVVDGLTE